MSASFIFSLWQCFLCFGVWHCGVESEVVAKEGGGEGQLGSKQTMLSKKTKKKKKMKKEKKTREKRGLFCE
ncbi:hypothetical protein BKA57DRAFT_468060 [Linnemannia elongata]|nr:hypothetical protein BKA57DRAFT_468060 [Linnemannia elongata]